MRAVRAALPRVPFIASISSPPLAHARRRARSLARSQLSVTRAVEACAGASATSTAAAAAPSNDARGGARARSKSLPAACAISAQCRVSRHHHANSLRSPQRAAVAAAVAAAAARSWAARMWRRRRRRRARGGGLRGAAAAIGSGGAQWRRPVRPAVVAHISPATHSRHHNGQQRPACAGRRVGRRGSSVVGRHRRPVCAGR